MTTVDKKEYSFPVSAFHLALAMIPMACIWFMWVPSSVIEKESLRRVIPLVPAGIGMLFHLGTFFMTAFKSSVRSTLISWRITLACYFVGYVIFIVMAGFFPEA